MDGSKPTEKIRRNSPKNVKCPMILLWLTLLTIFSQFGLGLAQVIQSTTFLPAGTLSLRMEESKTVVIEVMLDRAQLPSKTFNLTVKGRIGDPNLANFHSQSMVVNPSGCEDKSDGDSDSDSDANAKSLSTVEASSLIRKPVRYCLVNASFTVNGTFLGVTKFIVWAQIETDKDESQPDMAADDGVTVKHLQSEIPSDEPPEHPETFNLRVLRSARAKKLNAIFVSTLGCLIILANVMMGCQLNLKTVGEVLKRPIAPAIGFFCQFAIMPAVAYGLARAIMLPVGLYSLGLGLFTSGCVPGGGASNFWTVLLDGNSDLSITMTFISTLAAFAMMPMWMMALGSQFLVPGEGQSIQIPYKNIFISLACLAPPLIIGILINRYLDKFASFIKKVLRPFLIFIIIFIVTFGTYANLYMFQLMTWRVLLGGLLLPWCGFGLGCFAALLSRQTPENVAAIAIETGVQNAGIAIMLLKISFPEPEGDIASAVPVVVSIFTPGPLLLGYSVHFIMKCLKARKEAGKEIEGEFLEDGPLDDKLESTNNSYNNGAANGGANGFIDDHAIEATELDIVNGHLENSRKGLL